MISHFQDAVRNWAECSRPFPQSPLEILCAGRQVPAGVSMPGFNSQGWRAQRSLLVTMQSAVYSADKPGLYARSWTLELPCCGFVPLILSIAQLHTTKSRYTPVGVPAFASLPSKLYLLGRESFRQTASSCLEEMKSQSAARTAQRAAHSQTAKCFSEAHVLGKTYPISFACGEGGAGTSCNKNENPAKFDYRKEISA